MGQFKAKCENCKGAKVLSETLRSYRFPDQSTLNIFRTFAWCNQCAEVMWAERLPALSELSEPIAVEWRSRRSAPAKCLTCGSSDIVPSRAGHTNSGNEKFEMDCPNCGGVIRVLREPVLSLDRAWILYTPEGDLIQDYEMAPSLGAVPRSKKS
jgi:hypothetical protein